MPIGSIIAIYFVTWWLCLFLVLPFGVKSHAEQGEEVETGNEPGAPWRANIGKKIIITTFLALAVVVLLLWGMSNPILQEYWR